mgnify:CR=1 FL=1
MLFRSVDSPARLSLQTMSEDIINYISTSLTSPEIPAFFSAEDADSLPGAASTVKVEGAYYVWEWRELEEILGSEDVKLFARHYGAELSGNVDARHDVQGELLGKVRDTRLGGANLNLTSRMPERARSSVQRGGIGGACRYLGGEGGERPRRLPREAHGAPRGAPPETASRRQGRDQLERARTFGPRPRPHVPPSVVDRKSVV